MEKQTRVHLASEDRYVIVPESVARVLLKSENIIQKNKIEQFRKKERANKLGFRALGSFLLIAGIIGLSRYFFPEIVATGHFMWFNIFYLIPCLYFGGFLEARNSQKIE